MRLLIGLGLDAAALAALLWLVALLRRIGSVNTERQADRLLRRIVFCLIVILMIATSGHAWQLR